MSTLTVLRYFFLRIIILCLLLIGFVPYLYADEPVCQTFKTIGTWCFEDNNSTGGILGGKMTFLRESSRQKESEQPSTWSGNSSCHLHLTNQVELKKPEVSAHNPGLAPQNSIKLAEQIWVKTSGGWFYAAEDSNKRSCFESDFVMYWGTNQAEIYDLKLPLMLMVPFKIKLVHEDKDKDSKSLVVDQISSLSQRIFRNEKDLFEALDQVTQELDFEWNVSLALYPADPDSPNTYQYEFVESTIPENVTHLLMLVKNSQTQRYQYLSMPIQDLGAPGHAARGLKITTQKLAKDRQKMEIILSRAVDERDLSAYSLYWGSGSKNKLRNKKVIAIIPKKSWYQSLGQQLFSPYYAVSREYRYVLIDEIPSEATHILAYTRNDEGEMSQGLAARINDYQLPKTQAKKIQFIDSGSTAEFLNGKVVISRSGKEGAISHYLLFWGSGQRKRLPNHEPIVTFEAKLLKKRKTIEYVFPQNTPIPLGATHLIVFTTDQKWYQEIMLRQLSSKSVSVKLPFAKPVLMSESHIKSQKDAERQTQSTEDPGYPLKNGAEWRIEDPRSLGISGIISVGGATGVAVFFDYNLSQKTQLHFQMDYAGEGLKPLYELLSKIDASFDSYTLANTPAGDRMRIERILFSVTYRTFFSNQGWLAGGYWGYGGGLGHTTLNYRGHSISESEGIGFKFDSKKFEHRARARGVLGLAELGWQGYEHYYFNLGIQPAFYVPNLYQDDFEESKITKFAGQRTYVKERWTQSKNLRRVFIGFGVFY
ncbi:hypothetical protein WDW89_02605 [Deltaproteobacteria bacterium TL4]